MQTQYVLRKIVAIVALLVGLSVASCWKPEAGESKDSNVDYWTCTMHPSVHAAKPGKCPICSMDLVPVMKRSASEAKSSLKPKDVKENKSGGKPKSKSAMPGMPGMKQDTQTTEPQNSE